MMRWLRLRKGDESLAYKIPALQGRNTNRWICKDLLHGLLGSRPLSKMREGGWARASFISVCCRTAACVPQRSISATIQITIPYLGDFLL